MSVQTWLNRSWYGPAPRPWLVPLEGLFGALSAGRRIAYRRGWFASARVAAPVVVVGNLTVGGAGKTPLVDWLARRLAAAGWRPGIATRGYRGRSKAARLVQATDLAAVVGDEPVLLARRSGRPVAVARERAAAARLLLASGCDLVICDDGLQHYALAREVEIAVIDGERRFGNGHLLPAGPLREPAGRLAQVDAVVVNGGEPRRGELAMRLEAEHAVPLAGGAPRPLAAFAGKPVHAVAGIGHPQRFFAMLRAAGIEPIEHPLDDHAPIGGALQRLTDRIPVLMTEKDAVKCLDRADERHFYVPVEARFGAADEAALLRIVEARLAGARRGATDEDEVRRG
ncbi:MAG: tetraacyldisaccharide 4'-kinase [Gammaproteobacteria bacterium]|nr:tetraacyldisaccharide 4'-kinase [Gammaproteobacteria bacterium]